MKSFFRIAWKKLVLGLIFAMLSVNVFAYGTGRRPVGSRPSRPSSSNHHHYHYYGIGVGEALVDLFSDMIFMFWAMDNLLINFDDYPYANGNYIKFYNDAMSYSNSRGSSDIEDITSDITDEAIYRQKYNDGQFYRYTFEEGICWSPFTNLTGNINRFEGYFWKFIGPVFENELYSPDFLTGTSSPDLMGNVRLGMQFSLIHSNFIDANWRIQWTNWYGNTIANGVNVGMTIRSYPFNPVLLEWRWDLQSFLDDGEKYIFDSTAELGFELNSPVELYVSYRFRNDELIGIGKDHSVGVGLKYNF